MGRKREAYPASVGQCGRTSDFSDREYFTYIITTRRMTSGELSNQRNGFVDLAIYEYYAPH
jgi:hypothetical protein